MKNILKFYILIKMKFRFQVDGKKVIESFIFTFFNFNVPASSLSSVNYRGNCKLWVDAKKSLKTKICFIDRFPS